MDSDKHAYDNSDAVLELSPSLQLLQFFAPVTWPANSAQDLDMSTVPVLLPSGQVVLAGKSRIVLPPRGAHLGGIGHPEAALGISWHAIPAARHTRRRFIFGVAISPRPPSPAWW